MMIMSTLSKRRLLPAALLLAANAAIAAEPDVCEPFMDGRIDESLLSTMLSAAEDGHLYRIQPDSSQIGFCVNSKLSRIEGSFRDFNGGVLLDPGARNNGQTMVLIRVDSLDIHGALIRSLLKGENFFDVERYPDMLFVSSGFFWTGPQTAVLRGDLTLRGITRPVRFDVTLTSLDEENPDDAGMILVKATATIRRADFGMDSLDSMVDGDVQLCLSVEARKYETLGKVMTGSGAPVNEMIGPVPDRRNSLAG